MRGRLGVLAVVLLSACSDAPDPTGTAPLRPQSVTVENLEHFSFLPPLAGGTFTGEFNPDLLPAVEVCHVVADACAELLVRFETGPDGISLGDEQYKVNWQIGGVTAGELYRISVLSGPWPNAVAMGSIDLLGTEGGGLADPASGASRNVQSTLPIKFRLEHGVLCTTYAPDPTASEPCLVLAVGPNGGTFVTADSLAGVTIPPGALNQWVNLYIERYEPFNQDDDALCLPTSNPQYQGCYRFKTEPDLSNFEPVNGDTLPVTAGVCPDPVVFQQGIFDQVDLYKWDEIDPASLVLMPERQIGFLNCPGTPYYIDHGGFAASWLPQPLRSLARLLAPASLYAGVISPFGGGLKDFSRIGWLRPLSLSKVSGDGQQGYLGMALPNDPVVRVTAAGAKVTAVIPVPGVPVQFAVSPDGSASPAAAVTDTNGYASTAWTLGTSAGANSLVVTASNPLADPNATDVQNFPNQAGVWGTVTFSATGVETPPPPPLSAYKVVFLSPLTKGKLTPKDLNTQGVPVVVRVCSIDYPAWPCEYARRVVSGGDYRFQWKADATDPVGRFRFSVLDLTSQPGTVLDSFVGAVAKDGGSPPKGVDFTFQLGSTVPIKFLLIAR